MGIGAIEWNPFPGIRFPASKMQDKKHLLNSSSLVFRVFVVVQQRNSGGKSLSGSATRQQRSWVKKEEQSNTGCDMRSALAEDLFHDLNRGV